MNGVSLREKGAVNGMDDGPAISSRYYIHTITISRQVCELTGRVFVYRHARMEIAIDSKGVCPDGRGSSGP